MRDPEEAIQQHPVDTNRHVRLRGVTRRGAAIAVALALSLTACANPFSSGDEGTATVANDPTDLVQGLEDLAVAAVDTELVVAADVEIPAEELMQASDLQAVTVEDLDEDFLAAMRDVRLDHPVLGIFNDTDMLRIAQGTCGTLQHQGTYEPVLELVIEQVELTNLSDLAALGVGDWIYASSEAFCPVTVEGLGQ